MGIQINFYMLPEDEKEFISYVLQGKDVVMIAAPFESKSPNIIGSLPEPFFKPFWHSIYFWHKNISRRNVTSRFENEVDNKGKINCKRRY